MLCSATQRTVLILSTGTAVAFLIDSSFSDGPQSDVETHSAASSAQNPGWEKRASAWKVHRSHLKDLITAANDPRSSPEWRVESVYRYVATCIQPGMSLAEVTERLGPRAWCTETTLSRRTKGGPALLGAAWDEHCYECRFEWLAGEACDAWTLTLRVSGPQGKINPRSLADLIGYSRAGFLPGCRITGFRLDWPYGAEVFEGDDVSFADTLPPYRGQE